MSSTSYLDGFVVLDRVLYLPDRRSAVLGRAGSQARVATLGVVFEGEYEGNLLIYKGKFFPGLKLDGVAQMVNVLYPVALVQANGNQVDAPVGVGAAVPL